MKGPVRKILTALLAAVFLFSGAKLLIQQRENAAGSSTYQEALQLARSERKTAEEPAPVLSQAAPAEAEPEWIVAPLDEEDPHVRDLENLDLEALRQVNPDVVGWIRIPDTPVDYPLMQGPDNDYYLNRTWDREPLSIGSIFLEYQTSPSLTDFNTIIYGHNMTTGAMFGSLRNYETLSYWEEHPYVYIRSDEGVYRYEIFSSYVAQVDSNAYGLAFSSERTQERFLAEITENSNIETPVHPEITDRILTLSTCSGIDYHTRRVVHARLPMIQREG